MAVPEEMVPKYMEIRVRLKYRLYFCASRKSLTPPRPMSELTLQPMYVWAQAGSPSLLRQRRLLLILSALKKFPFLHQTFTEKKVCLRKQLQSCTPIEASIIFFSP